MIVFRQIFNQRKPAKRTGHLALLSAALLAFSLGSGAEQKDSPYVVNQAKGVDQRIDYRTLEKFGPWDDRNYSMTSADLNLLSREDAKIRSQLPAFFRVELRRKWPHLRRSGPAQYPRAALQMFHRKYGGLMRNGAIESDRRVLARRRALSRRIAIRNNKEVQLNEIEGANEISVEINPTDSTHAIAGANNYGGQEMYYSTDGGANWIIQGELPDTCCDPSIDFSSDGTIAYVAALSGDIGVSTWRSFDGGQTWVDRVYLTESGSDKEFIHVDKSPQSPFQDNVYLTYHNGNVMQFARSTDSGLSYDIQEFPEAPYGIGSDITTDSAGNIYYFYAAFGGWDLGDESIILLKSTDGGETFESPATVAETNGEFDFPIPAQETRGAWVYAAADSDRSGGSFDGSIYVAWTDTYEEETNNPETNHTQIKVAYSRDGGETWGISLPHPVDDVETVDRFNQWLTVDEYGNVHVVYYDTQHSESREDVDFYYSMSADGAVNWSTPERITSETSANLTDGQEYGDYNGLSVVGDNIVSAWTDNREGPPNAKDVYADDKVNDGAIPGFLQSASPTSQLVCAPGDLEPIEISILAIQGFDNPVTLNFSDLPGGFSGGFNSNSVTPASPANTATAQISVGAISGGEYSFRMTGTATGANERSTLINVAVLDSGPSETASLLEPTDGSTDIWTAPRLAWTEVPGASSYTIEIDDDADFSSIDFTLSTSETSVMPDTSLLAEQQYYWRVSASNLCGSSPVSQSASFTTGLYRSPFMDIPDDGNSAFDTFVIETPGQLADLNLMIQATHTWVGDLSFNLVHEDSGTTVSLMHSSYDPDSPVDVDFACSGENIDATLDDDANTSVQDACDSEIPAISGSFAPYEELSAFNGEDFSGTWRLDVTDYYPFADKGTLVQWGLVPTFGGTEDDSDGDGVADISDFCPGTVIPESVPTKGRLGKKKWALTEAGSLDFVQGAPQTNHSFNTIDTAGCSCEQIVEEGGYPSRFLKRGCSTSIMKKWARTHHVLSGQDSDDDGVDDAIDFCPGTVIPESVPTKRFGKNKWALTEAGNFNFFQAPPQSGSRHTFTTADTAGCSCEQIVEESGYPKGYLKRGCPTSKIKQWARKH